MDLQYETVDEIKKNEHWYDTCDVAVAKKKTNDAPQIRRVGLSWKNLIILFLVVLIVSLCTSLAVSVLMNISNDNLPLSVPKTATDTGNTMRDCLAMKENDSLSSGVYSLVLNDTMLLDVYCDMTTHKGGWIVFQKRFNGKENFYRDWHAYENGFGDLNGEFWIGNKYLHILTQVPTELRIDLKAWDRQTRYAEYSTFVIGDAESNYTLSIDGYHGDAGNKQNCRNVQSSVSASKQDDNQISRMIEDVNKTKEDLMVIHDMRKELVDYLTDIKNTTRKELLIVKTSFDSTLHLLNEIRKTSEQELSKINETRNIAWEFYAEFRNKSKTEQLSKMQSTNQFLEFRTEMRNMNFNETRIIQQWRNESKVQYQEFRRKSQQDLMSFQEMRYDILKVLAATDMCVRNETFNMTEPTQPTDIASTRRDCLAWKQNGSLTDGVYSISPDDTTILNVYCDMTTDGGGWVVFQRRSDGSENFFRDWQAYEDGFGTILGEFWIGNKYLHILTQVPTELRIDLEAWDGQKRYAKYSSFVIGDAHSKYTLSVDGFGGNAGDGLAYHHGLKFSTHDQDNTQTSTTCAARNKGAWWYKACSHSSLNGEYLKTNGRADQNMGINWEKFKGDRYSLKGSSMMLRRKT